MKQITLRDVSFGYIEPLFEKVNITISSNDRVGIVGNNGEGKSSLLDCIAGIQTGYTGEITRPKGARIEYVEQGMPSDLEKVSLYDAIASGIPEIDRISNEWKVDIALDMFDVPHELRERNIEDLSGGWQRLALIARAAMSDPDVLILDEPTNHLDLGKTFSLERWLSEQIYNVPVVIVSHDRAFLDKCTNRTVFLRKSGVSIYKHSFTRARELLFEDDKSLFSKRVVEMEELKRLEKSAHKQRQIGKDNYSDTALQKAKQIERRAQDLRESLTDIHTEEKRDISLTSSTTHNKCLLQMTDLNVFSPTGDLLFKIDTLEVNSGDRVVILGANGTGKTCFFTLLREYSEKRQGLSEGKLNIPPSVKVGIIDQHLSNLSQKDTLRGFISDSSNEPITQQRVSSLLASAGFKYEMQETRIETLSYGQKARLNLVGLRLRNPALFLMDEPTNNLDISGQEALEGEVKSHTNAAVIVSHDRTFVKNLGTKYFVIQNKKLKEISDPEEYYMEERGGPTISTS